MDKMLDGPSPRYRIPSSAYGTSFHAGTPSLASRSHVGYKEDHIHGPSHYGRGQEDSGRGRKCAKRLVDSGLEGNGRALMRYIIVSVARVEWSSGG
jgi:hypothetical protein